MSKSSKIMKYSSKCVKIVKTVKTVDVLLIGPRLLTINGSFDECLYLCFHENTHFSVIFRVYSPLSDTWFRKCSKCVNFSVFIKTVKFRPVWPTGLPEMTVLMTLLMTPLGTHFEDYSHLTSVSDDPCCTSEITRSEKCRHFQNKTLASQTWRCDTNCLRSMTEMSHFHEIHDILRKSRFWQFRPDCD